MVSLALAERRIRHEQLAGLEVVETPGMGSVRLWALQDPSAQRCLRRYQARAVYQHRLRQVLQKGLRGGRFADPEWTVQPDDHF
jgi:hypothetical protein